MRNSCSEYMYGKVVQSTRDWDTALAERCHNAMVFQGCLVSTAFSIPLTSHGCI